MNRLLLVFLLTTPIALQAQSALKIKAALQGSSLSKNTSERLHATRQQLLNQHYQNVPGNAIDQAMVAIVSSEGVVLEKQSAWLTFEGTLLSLEGVEYLTFYKIEAGSKLVLQHRNHLALVSKPLQSSTNREAVLDLTNPDVLQGNSYLVENGKAYAFAGNLGDMHFERRSYINAMDLFFFRADFVQESKPQAGAYPSADLNLDGVVDDNDLQIVQTNSDQIPSVLVPSIR